jgi:Prp18 domain
MIVDAICNRNYLYGYDIYMRLAIGACHGSKCLITMLVDIFGVSLQSALVLVVLMCIWLSATEEALCVTAGNAPWPIGVTSIGIHERSSREKISHATGMNVGGAAHIMNDEATRKYLQVPLLLAMMTAITGRALRPNHGALHGACA